MGEKHGLRIYPGRKGARRGDSHPESSGQARHESAIGEELHDAVRQAEADEAIGCIIITGAGDRAFSAGGDIHEQRENDRRYTQELDARGAIRSRGSYEISACAKPTIGMMNGLAYGGAAVLASSLDMRIGCEHSRFRFLAAAYGRINTWTLPNQVGGRLPKSYCSQRVWSRRRKPIASVCSTTWCRVPLREKTMELATMIANNRRRGHGREGVAAPTHGTQSRGAMGRRTGLHDSCGPGCQGRRGFP